MHLSLCSSPAGCYDGAPYGSVFDLLYGLRLRRRMQPRLQRRALPYLEVGVAMR